MPVETTKRWRRVRIRSPGLFIKSSFRVLDIGEPKKHMLVRARLKSTGDWATQAVMIDKETWKKDKKTSREIIRKARKY